MAEVLKFSPAQSEALLALGRYKFLNSPQISGIVGCSASTVTRSFKPLKGKLIEALDFGVTPGVGRIPQLFFLRPKGAKLLEEWGAETIRFPNTNISFQGNAYAHRIGLVDFQIALDKFLENLPIELLFFETDFDFTGSNRGGKSGQTREQLTRISLSQANDDHIIPDLVFALSMENGDTPFFLVEYHRGKDSLRSINQLIAHAKAIREGHPTFKYRDRVGERSPRVLCVYEQEGTRNAVARRMLQDARFSDLGQFFIFATLDEVKANFGGAWKTLNGEAFSL